MKKTILIIDDEMAILDSTAQILDEFGYNVLTALSVKQAKQYLHSHTDISLVMTDIQMPVEDGFAILSYMKENLRLKDIPVLVFSAFSEQEVVLRAISLGAKDYITKPFRFDNLIAKFEQIISASTKNVLLVTDNESTISILERTLKTIRYSVIPAENGKEAIEILKTGNISVVISEMKLSDTHGFELIAELKNIYLDLPILCIVDQKSNFSLTDILHKGGDGIIERPFKNSDIIQTFNSLEKTPV